MQRQNLSSPRLAAPRFRYTPCVKRGALAWLSGMVALDPATGQLVSGGVGPQTQRIFDNLTLALPDYGLRMADLCVARLYTTVFEEFGAINEVWERQFASLTPPARTALGVTHLPLGALVEIEFCFYTASGGPF